MRNLLSAAVCVLLATALSGATEVPIRLDVTSQPVGAQVRIDGTDRGVTPLTLLDIAPGRHLVDVFAPSFRPADEVVILKEGDFTQKNFSLRAEKGLLLVRTDPAGAEVSCNGLSLGSTPLLVTTLDSGASYQLALAMNGYQAKTIDVRLDGRTPVVRDEKLSLDSGIVEVSSQPAGAEVLVNGASRGVTPVTVERVPKGVATFTLKLDGYETETRELTLVAGDHQSLSVRLKGRPTKLTVVSIPDGARVYVDDEFQGKAPATVLVAGGAHRVRAELPGYASSSRTVTLANGAASTEEFRLASTMGRLEITTAPVGVEILLDGKVLGKSVSKHAGAALSNPYAVEDVAEGEHALTVRLKGYAEAHRRIKVSPKTTAAATVRLSRMFIPDVSVDTYRGSTYKGVLISKDDIGGVRLEISPGVEQTIPSADVKKMTPIEAK